MNNINFLNPKNDRHFVPQISSIYEDAIITDIRLIADQDSQYFTANGTFQRYGGIYFTYELNGKKYKWNYKVLETDYKNSKAIIYCKEFFHSIEPNNRNQYDNIMNKIFTVKFYKHLNLYKEYLQDKKAFKARLSLQDQKNIDKVIDIIKETQTRIDYFNNEMKNKVVGKRVQVKVSSRPASSNKAKSPEDQDCLLTFRPSSYHKATNTQNIISIAAKSIPQKVISLPSQETIDNWESVPF